ncbi:LacI family DNA-binding transcriptional regulator [Streptomyces sp. NPDC046887]|uniref:LacI family DNA-binding transcriptional regulator n=1 Tax=Streptomyces sp. NPDC046887 TaxID=3155472 RepID=UPI00340EDC63
MPRVTRDDVARLAGTSTAVVSYVINDGPRPVAASTRKRVVAAIAELGYTPNSVAQAMARRRTNLLGVVVPDARQPFFAGLTHAVEQAAAERGKLVLIGNSDYADEREDHYIRAFLGMQVDGLILISQNPSALSRADLSALDSATRVVMLHHRTDASGHAAVVTDDSGGARLAVGHLLEHGHRRIACFGASRTCGPSDPVIARVAGWAATLADAGLPTDGLLTEAPFDRVNAHTVARRLLDGPDRPSAVFCVTDDQAIGLLRAAAELSIRVPEDLAVVAFDDIAEAVIAGPPLTTVASAQRTMARAAVDLALKAGPLSFGEEAVVREFPVTLRVRRSCGCPLPDGVRDAGPGGLPAPRGDAGPPP